MRQSKREATVQMRCTPPEAAVVVELGPTHPPIARVRFMRSGAILCLDANRQRIPELCCAPGIYLARRHVARILAAARAQAQPPVIEEQRYGRFRPLEEGTLARFEDRAAVGDRERAVGIL